MFNELFKHFKIGENASDIVYSDITDIYETLNKSTNNNWTYIINEVKEANNSFIVIITLLASKRVMSAVGYDPDIQKAIDKALTKAFTSIAIKSTNTNIKTIEELDSSNNIKQNEELEDDDVPFSENCTITKRQIKLINNFRKLNEIDNDDKFNYYIKTWSDNEGINNIKNKNDLIASGHLAAEDFIKWIYKMQPVLKEGIKAPEGLEI